MNRRLAQHISNELVRIGASKDNLEKHELTIECTPNVWNKFERFLCFMHYNGGHSGTFAMSFDGDGSDVLKVSPEPSQSSKDGVHEPSNVGYGVEIANEDGYSGYFIDWDKTNNYKGNDKKE